ncbi:MAG: phosphoglucomutase/phosphomannomutase family protein, partial [Pseudothermotoga sp.]
NTRIDFKLSSEEEKQELLSKFKNMKDYLSGIKIVSQDSIDGTRYLFDKSGAWILARASGTEPVVRIYLEAKDLQTFQSMLLAIRKMSRQEGKA